MKNIFAMSKKEKLMTISKWIIIISFVAAISCFATYSIIGSELLSDGTLVEPFVLIPMGYVFIFIAIVSLIGYLIFKRKSK